MNKCKQATPVPWYYSLYCSVSQGTKLFPWLAGTVDAEMDCLVFRINYSVLGQTFLFHGWWSLGQARSVWGYNGQQNRLLLIVFSFLSRNDKSDLTKQEQASVAELFQDFDGETRL